MTSHHPNPHDAPGAPKSAPPPAVRETGWLPDYVYTEDRFATGLAFFADDLGRITRFSREPADLAAARRLSGQAALPGLVNVHSRAWQRVLRGRNADPAGVGSRLTDADLYDAARMAFMEMMLAGITCVGEFHTLHHQPDGTPWPDPNHLSHEMIRAARDTGIRLALAKTACARIAGARSGDSGLARGLTPAPDVFLRELDALREYVAHEHPGGEIWVGAAAESLRTVPVDFLKVLADYAHAQRLRLQIPVSEHPADNEACAAEYGRTPVTLLAEHGILDKRFTAVHAAHLTDEESRLLGAARATVCVCPGAQRSRGASMPAIAPLVAAGAAIALGSDDESRVNLIADAWQLERQGAPGAEPALHATTLLQAATVAGARSLGAPNGALEVGRPADFFTVNLFDPAMVGATADTLLDHILVSLERRAIREVWVGARQVVANGRHPYQGAIVSRFAELQRRLWAAASS